MSAASRYLDHLPAVFQEDTAAGEDTNWLGHFLRGFEAVLTGTGDPQHPGLEELLDGIRDPVTGEQVLRGIERLFDPGPPLVSKPRNASPAQRTGDEFLEWLSGWVALSLRADVGTDVQRVLIANAVRLYKLRGTKLGLTELIGIYTTLGATIEEASPRMQIGVHSTIGVDTALDGGSPYYFRATVRLPTNRPEEIAAKRRIVKAIIDAEKPAHTYYTLSVETPTFQIGRTSTIGLDTLIGTSPPT